MSTEWLKAKVPGFGQLSEQERSLITDFGLLWSLFEARIVNRNANPKAIRTAVHAWHATGSLDAESYAPELAYFRSRYFENGAYTYHFNQLGFRPNPYLHLVEGVISGQNDAPSDCVAATLLIIYRFRNNLFHGEKWRYKFAGQLDNFTNANSTLIKTLERHGRLDQDE